MDKVQPLKLDGCAALQRFTSGGFPVSDMSGKEMYAILEHLKEDHFVGALEEDMLKLRRPFDKKERLMTWVHENLTPVPSIGGGPAAPPAAPPAAAAPQEQQRPQTAPAQQRAGSNPVVFEVDAAPPRAGAADAHNLIREILNGKDHATLSGNSYFGLVAYLKGSGHPELESELMRVKLLGDKKFQLVAYVKKHCAGMQMLEVVEHPPTPQQSSTEPPMQQMAQQPPMQSVQMAQMQQQMQMQMQAMQMQAIQPPASGAIQQHVQTLAQTLARMEESHAFAVECMRADMKQARGQLEGLKSVLEAGYNP